MSNKNHECRFCGCGDDLLTHAGFTGKRNIECIGCGARGPTRKTIALAWASWNSPQNAT